MRFILFSTFSETFLTRKTFYFFRIVLGRSQENDVPTSGPKRDLTGEKKNRVFPLVKPINHCLKHVKLFESDGWCIYKAIFHEQECNLSKTRDKRGPKLPSEGQVRLNTERKSTVQTTSSEGKTRNRQNREQKRAKKLRAEGFGRAEAGHKQTSAKGPRTSVAMSP